MRANFNETPPATEPADVVSAGPLPSGYELRICEKQSLQ